MATRGERPPERERQRERKEPPSERGQRKPPVGDPPPEKRVELPPDPDRQRPRPGKPPAR